MIGIVGLDSRGEEVGSDSEGFVGVMGVSGRNGEVVDEEVVLGRDVLESVEVDLRVDVVDGGRGEVGFYF